VGAFSTTKRILIRQGVRIFVVKNKIIYELISTKWIYTYGFKQAGPRTKDENANTKNCIRVFSIALKRIPHREEVVKDRISYKRDDSVWT